MIVTYRFIRALLVFMASTSISLVVCEAEDDRKTNEDSILIDFDDDSTTVSEPLEALHLVVEPTPGMLDQLEAQEVVRTVNDLLDAFLESTEDHTYRTVELGPITGIQFRSSGGESRRLRRSIIPSKSSNTPTSSRNLNSSQRPATILEISGGEIRYREATPSTDSLKQLIQTAVNSSFESAAPSILRSSGSLVEGIGIQKITLTWESEGYTLAPSPSPKSPKPDSDSDSDSEDLVTRTNPTTTVGEEPIQPGSNAVQLSIFMGLFSTLIIIAALFVAKRRRRKQLEHFRRDRVEGSGIEFVHDSIHPDEGAFPSFTFEEKAPVVTRIPTKNPADIEIAIPDGKEAESDISSLSDRGGGGGGSSRTQTQNSLMLSLNRVNNSDMYVGTAEGFDFLGGPERYPVYNPFASNGGRPTRLLGPTGESLWYSSSSAASEDTSLQFDVSKDWNPDDNDDDNNGNDDDEGKVEDELLTPPIALTPKTRLASPALKSRRNEQFYDHGFCDDGLSDDQSSLGLRSIT